MEYSRLLYTEDNATSEMWRNFSYRPNSFYSVKRKGKICPGIACVALSANGTSHAVALLAARTAATFCLNFLAAAVTSSSLVLSELGLNTSDDSARRKSGFATLKRFESSSHPTNFYS